MAVLLTYGTFRWVFADQAEISGKGLVFSDDNPDRILRIDFGGDFVADGFTTGKRVQASSTANNNNYYTIESSTAAIITLDADDSVTAEGPVVVPLKAWFVDNDGSPQWPEALVRSGGFDGGIGGIPTPYDSVAFEATVNASAADAIKNVHEYEWYLSQRTDDPNKQYLSIAQKASTGAESYSGTVSIEHTGLATSVFGVSPSVSIDPDVQRKLFKFMHLYVKRISDGAIQWVDLLSAMTANVG